jgi:hypothetical protein
VKNVSLILEKEISNKCLETQNSGKYLEVKEMSEKYKIIFKEELRGLYRYF